MSSKTRAKFYRRTDVKLTLWYIFTFFLSVLVIFGFLYARLKHQLIKEIDRMLHDEADELSGILVPALKGMDVFWDFENTVTARTYYPIYFRILNRDGSLFYVSRNFTEIAYKDSSNDGPLSRGMDLFPSICLHGARLDSGCRCSMCGLRAVFSLLVL